MNRDTYKRKSDRIKNEEMISVNAKQENIIKTLSILFKSCIEKDIEIHGILMEKSNYGNLKKIYYAFKATHNFFNTNMENPKELLEDTCKEYLNIFCT